MELRSAFHRDLETIDQQVRQLFALVSEGLAGATDALLAGDREAARDLVARDKMLDTLYVHVEDVVQRQFALQAPMANDLRFLLSVLRIVPELERSGDLAEHIAQRAARGLTGELTPRVRGLIHEMGRVGVELWRQTAHAYTTREAGAGERLRELDDELDDLHVSFISELTTGQFSVPVAIELALVGRFYERLGDHAVNIAARVHYLATGGF
ncbi:MAG: phosphate signaling complex protein PhoU [Acidimicrobiales bacterium]|nr:phosphate signaling complex protein PhoU [Actinomycetota bacterium]